jgi:hypothetical protein
MPRPPIGLRSDDQHGVTVFARVPEGLGEEERRSKYDRPLERMILEAGVGNFLRGFSQVGRDGRVEWVGLEMQIRTLADVGLVGQFLQQLGVPRETVLECDTEDASAEFSLADLRDG